MFRRVFHTVILALCGVVNLSESWEVRKQYPVQCLLRTD
jgi:hypothetical protein